MRSSLRYGVGFLAILGVLTALSVRGPRAQAQAITAAPAVPDSSAWTVIFRSDNPLMWNTDAGHPSTQNGYGIRLAEAPADMRFLKLTRMDSGEAVIVPLTVTRAGAPVAWKRDQLGKTANLDGGAIWNGGQTIAMPDGSHIRMLGIAERTWAAKTPDQQMVIHGPGARAQIGSRGWGFSRPAGPDASQTYSWAGNSIEKTVFEIAVKNSDLTDDEQPLLATNKAPANPDTPASPTAPTETAETANSIQVSGPTTQLTRLQATIKALSVRPLPSGEMLGDAEDFILTATPGKPKGDTIPVTFTSRVGPEGHMVMDDVLRALNANYPHAMVAKYEFSFEDSTTGHEGPSIGAACGTLMLSLLENFKIDPNLAITGDVAANGRVHAIGGTAAKLRGAIAADAKIVALPSENYDQVSDAFVYEGPTLLTNIQVIGISDLDDAMAVARVDRAPDLAKAITEFSDVQGMLKGDPYRIHDLLVRTKLTDVLTLEPNHFSAKLLLLMAEHKEPSTLSAAATNYYVDLTVHTMMPGLYDKKPNVTLASPAVVHDGLAKLQKIRHCADPEFVPYVNAVQGFMLAMNDYAQQRISLAALQIRAQAVLDQRDKLNTDRDLLEKMLHEGV
jgi:hypothetical protein